MNHKKPFYDLLTRFENPRQKRRIAAIFSVKWKKKIAFLRNLEILA